MFETTGALLRRRRDRVFSGTAISLPLASRHSELSTRALPARCVPPRLGNAAGVCTRASKSISAGMPEAFDRGRSGAPQEAQDSQPSLDPISLQDIPLPSYPEPFPAPQEPEISFCGPKTLPIVSDVVLRLESRKLG